MAETYRGLTIRIGGDTTQLSEAIKGANRDASNLQSVLRKATSALNFDPSSIAAATLKMNALTKQSTELYGKFKILQGYASKIEISRSFQDAQAHIDKTGDSVGKATDRFNAYNAQLEEMKRRFAALDGVDLSKQANYTEWNKGASEAIANMAKLGTVTQEDYTAYKKLATAQQEAQSALDMTKQVAQMEDLRAEIQKTEANAKSLAEQYVKLYASTSSASKQAYFSQVEANLTNAKNAAMSLDAQLDQVNSALEFNPNGIAVTALKMDLLKEKAGTAENQLKNITSRMNQLESAVGAETLAQPFENLSLKLETTKSNFTEITAKINTTKGALSTLENQLEIVKQTGGTINGKGFTELNTEVEKTRAELSKLEASLDSTTKEFNTTKAQNEYRELQTQAEKCKSTILEANAAIKGSNSKLEGWSSSFTNIGLTLATTVTPAVQRFMSSSVESAEEIDSAYRNMRKTVSGSEEEFEALKQSAVNFSQTHVTSADQILEIQAMGGQLGIAVSDLDKFSQVVSNLNIATNISDAQEMAEQLGQLASITGMTSDQYDKFADSLVRLGNNSPTLESDIMDISSRIGSMGSIVGMSVPEILALSTALASTGQQSEAAGTALSNTMSDIEGAVSEGGDKLANFAAVAGTSAEEFASKWQNSPVEAIRDFVAGLKNIEDNGGSADTTLEELGITGVRQKQALLGLSKTVDVLDDSLAMSRDAWNGISDQWGEAGDAAREAEKKAEGFSGQLSILQNNAQVLGASLAESLAPILETLNGAFTSVTSAIDGMDDSQKQAILGLAGVASAGGAVLTGLGAFIPVITNSMNKQRLMNAAMESFGVQSVTATSGIAKLGQKMAGSTGIISKFGTALAKHPALMSAGAAGAVSLAVIIGSQLVSAYQEAKEKEETFKQSTEGLINVHENAQRAAQDTASAVDLSGESAENATKSYQGLTEKMQEQAQEGAELAETNKKQWEDIYTNSALLDRYVDTIERLGQKGNLSKSEVVELKNAVEGYNEITGSSIEVVDEQTGEISEQADELKKNADAWRKQAEEEARASQNKEYVKRSIELQDSLTKAQQSYNDAVKEGVVSNQQVEQLKQATAEFNANEIAISKNNDALNGGQQSLVSWIGTQNNLMNALNTNGVKVTDFANNFEALGLTQNQLAEATPGQLDIIAQAYANMSNSSVGFDQAKAAMDGLGFSLQQMAELSPNQVALVVGAYQGFQNAGIPMDQLKQKFEEVGISEQDLANLTPGQVAQITNAWNNGSTDIDGICNAIQTNTRDHLYSAGDEGGQAFSNALGSHTGEAESSGQSLHNAAESGANTQDSYDWGSHLGSNFAKGIASAWDAVKNAAANLLSATSDIHFSVPKTGMWSGAEKGGKRSGQHFVENFASGIRYATPEVVNAVNDMNKQVERALKTSSAISSIVYNADIATNGAAFTGVNTVRNTTKLVDANERVVGAISELRTDISAYNQTLSTMENAVYVDGKKLVSTIAKPMNKQLGVLQKRGC